MRWRMRFTGSYDSDTCGATKWSRGVTYLPTFRKCDHYVGLVIRPNVHINTEGGVHGVGWIVSMIRQYWRSQILVLLSCEKCDCILPIDCNFFVNVNDTRFLYYRPREASGLSHTTLLYPSLHWDGVAKSWLYVGNQGRLHHINDGANAPWKK